MVDLRAEYRVLGRQKTATVDDNHQLCRQLFIALQSCRAPVVRGLRQVGQERPGPSYVLIPLVLGPLNSLGTQWVCSRDRDRFRESVHWAIQ